MRILRLACLLFVGASLHSFAQSDNTIVKPDSGVSTSGSADLYTFSLMAGGGFARDVSTFDAPQPGIDINRNQFSVFGRILWTPEHRLSGGLEVGYMNLYSETANNGGTIVRSAIPIMMIFDMRIVEGFHFSAGFGLAPLATSTKGQAGSIDVSSISTSVMGAASYLAPLSDKFNLGGEVRYTSMDHLDDRVLSVSVLVSYKLSEY